LQNKLNGNPLGSNRINVIVQNKNSNLGTNVAGSRKKLGLSQEALAEKANVSLSTIQRIEKGTVKPRPFTLKIIAETLDLKVDDLLKEFVEKEIDSSELRALKQVNRVTLFLAFIPFVNMVLPMIIWRFNKQINSRNESAGKMVSFQLLWSIVALVLASLSIFLTNLITGEAGEGHYTSVIVFLFAVLFNIYVIAKTATNLGAGNTSILPRVPNFF